MVRDALCIDCKYGHECPYMTTDDMEHALIVEGDEVVVELMGKIRELLEQLRVRVKEVFKVSKRFYFSVYLAECEGFEEGFKVDWDAEDLKDLNILLIELYRLRAECRSKVGVRVPFELYDGLVALFERFELSGKGHAIISDN